MENSLNEKQNACCSTESCCENTNVIPDKNKESAGCCESNNICSEISNSCGGVLSEKERELVAIGASIGGNCIPCLEWHYDRCMELGFTKEEMQEAFNMAKKVKEVPNKKIYEAADNLIK